MSYINCLRCHEQMQDRPGLCPHCGWEYTQTIQRQVCATNGLKHEYNQTIKFIIAALQRNSISDQVILKALKQFDYIWQYVFYCVSVMNDRRVSAVEKDLLENIVQYGDLIKDDVIDISIPELNQKLNWRILDHPRFGSSTLQKLVGVIGKYVTPNIYEFVVNILTSDAFTKLKTGAFSSTMIEIEGRVVGMAGAFADAAWSTDTIDKTKDGITTAEVIVSSLLVPIRKECEQRLKQLGLLS